MTDPTRSRRLTAGDVLQRYKDEELPAFCEVPLTNVNQVGNFGERPLHVAAARGDVEELRALLEAGADVNAPGELGHTALQEAVLQNHVPAVELLLAYGASPDNINKLGQSSLDLATMFGHDQILEALEQPTTKSKQPGLKNRELGA